MNQSDIIMTHHLREGTKGPRPCMHAWTAEIGLNGEGRSDPGPSGPGGRAVQQAFLPEVGQSLLALTRRVTDAIKLRSGQN